MDRMSDGERTRHEHMQKILKSFVVTAQAELDEYWSSTPLDLTATGKFEVLGGLLARQLSLARSMAQAPSTWTAHAAPVLLRPMIDLFINLSWIIASPDSRSKEYINYGLGQEKLFMEHVRARAETIENAGEHIAEFEDWINAQRYTFLTEVNLGSWTGGTTRDQAIETDLKDLYDMAYTPFSWASHSTWNHVAKNNLAQCPNPLHKFHRVPSDPSLPPDPHYVWLAAKYLERAFEVYCDHFALERLDPTAFSVLTDGL